MEKKTKGSKGFTKAYGDEGNIKIIIGIMDKHIKVIAKIIHFLLTKAEILC